MRRELHRDARAREVTGWHLRAGLLACALLAVAVSVGGETSERLGLVSVVGTGLLVLGAVVLPGTAFPTALLVVLCLPLLDRPEPSLPGLVALAALLHAVHLLAALCALGPPQTRFAVAALLASLRRWAVSQVLALPVVVAVWWVAGSGVRQSGVADAVEVGAGVLAAVLVFGTVALARRRLR
ncbi:MAG: hypothetical protein ACLGIA_13330 [Actinomycetes bacterium]